jgi:hypothetical protein
MSRISGILITMFACVLTIAASCPAQDATVYVTGKVRASLLTICPWADSYVLNDNSLGEDLFLKGEMLMYYEGARVEIVGLRTDHGDCVVIDIEVINYLPSGQRFGDVNRDGFATPLDLVAGINYLLMAGPAPVAGWRSVDLNADGKTNLVDLVRLVNYVYGYPASVMGTVTGSYPCADTIGAYPGCKYWIMKNAIPLDTGTVDQDGEFWALLPPDYYQLALFPPESHLPGFMNINLTQGHVVLPTINFDRQYVDSLLFVTPGLGVTEDRIREIAGYLGGDIVEIIAGPPPPTYVISLQAGLHFEHAMQILSLFPEIEHVQPVAIVCQ